MKYSKPQVTIDLEEYQELQRYREFDLSSKDLNFVMAYGQTNPNYLHYDLILSSTNLTHSSIGSILFTDTNIRDIVLNDWEIKFIKKQK